MNKTLSPLEALERIKYIANEVAQDIDNPRYLVDELSIIETALKQHKALMEAHPLNIKNNMALEFIKNKLIFNFNDYAKSITIRRNNSLMHIILFFDNQEEYDLLKEVLKDE